MLIPHPESDLTRNILVLGAEILAILKRKESFTVIEEAMEVFLNKNPQRTPELFLDALTSLYVAGLLEVQGYKTKAVVRDVYTQSPLF